MATAVFAFGNISRVGGTERRMAEVCSALASMEVGVHVVFRSAQISASVENIFNQPGVSITARKGWLPYLGHLFRLSRKEARIVSFGLKPSMAARIVRCIRGKKVVHSMARNGLDYTWPRYFHLADWLTSRLVDTYITNSRAAEAHLIKQRIPEERIEVLISGLPAHWYKRADDAGIPIIKNPRVIMVGNSRPEKNQKLGIEALIATRVPVTLDVYTDDATDLRKAVSDRIGSQLNISYHEGVMVTPERYDRADILLHPSLSESLPRTVLEGTARGCVVVAFDTGDTAEIVDESRSTILPVGASSDELSDALSAVFNQLPSLRRSRPVSTAGNDVETYTQKLAALIGLQVARQG